MYLYHKCHDEKKALTIISQDRRCYQTVTNQDQRCYQTVSTQDRRCYLLLRLLSNVFIKIITLVSCLQRD
jgi:hypothetical protein